MAEITALAIGPTAVLDAAGGHGGLNRMTEALAEHLRTLIDPLDATVEATPEAADKLIADLTDRMRSAPAWAKLLDLAAAAPTTLAPHMITPLLAPDLGLLSHPMTLHPAARMIAAAAPHLSDDTHHALEQRIWALADQADESADADGAEQEDANS